MMRVARQPPADIDRPCASPPRFTIMSLSNSSQFAVKPKPTNSEKPVDKDALHRIPGLCPVANAAALCIP